MTYKALISDLDGTLLNDNKRVGDKDLELLHQLGKSGIIRVIATGRSLFSFSEVIPDDYPLDYLILAAGAATFDLKNKQLIKSHCIKSGNVNEIISKLNLLKVDYQIRAKVPESHKYYFKQFSKFNPDFDRLNLHYKEHINFISERGIDEDATRIICIAQNIDIIQTIEKEFSEYSIIRATSPIDNQSIWMEIYPKGVNKGAAVKDLCENLNIRLNEIVAVGNDYNDIHMLDIAGKAYVVSNSPLDLKAKYEVTVSNNENPLFSILGSQIG